MWHWVDYTPATQVRRRLRASSQRELIETDLNWNIDNLSDSSCSTIIPGSGFQKGSYKAEYMYKDLSGMGVRGR